MRQLNQVSEYISDEKFSNSLKIKCTEYLAPLRSRVENLVKLSENKKVLHLGCCDHIGLIDEKMKQGQWLHARIKKVSTDLLGIDINDEAIAYLRTKGVTDIIKGDVTNIQKIDSITEKKWDVIIAAEIIEHTNNPVNFLSALRENYKDSISEIVISVPNAFSFNNLRFAFANVEAINTDHRYWFTPFTISKILYNAGFKVEEIILTNGHNDLKLTNFPRIWMSRFFPMLRDTLIVRAKF